jgi:hypothetical protein
LEGAKKAQSKTDKPISFFFLSAVASQACEVCFMPGLILWLRLAIEQQYRRRKVQVKNPDLAEWLNTSVIQVIKYKNLLRKLDFLNVDTSKKIPKLSVNFFPD